ncbi:MAG: sigma-54-dependent Fis family transcriptional regulator [Deltaproteobacteria bacterium]|nr:sigma-54-dependent Fis family transcriptional regulator [Deltaproteobacteria bacterium]
MAHILIVDDEERMRHLLSIMLDRQGHQVAQAGDGAEALDIIDERPFDMVIADIKMPRMDGMELLGRITEMEAPCPVVIITAFATIDSAVDAMRRGAADFITKPFEEDRILSTVERTLSLSRIMVENRDLKAELRKVAGGDEIVYGSAPMSEAMGLASRVAESDTAVLIAGESGTGKELMARFIHRAGSRAGARFVPVNCAAISPGLVESELFGYEKGAFTGADRRTAGKFEYASDGTLFLDEIGDLPGAAQAKLLRALQEKKIQRVGGNKEIPVDVRVICATNQDLDELVRKGAFRRDLFFRVNVFPIYPPPLRERKDDIPLLSRYFLGGLGQGSEPKLTEGAERMLQSCQWPGNVRELANAMERAFILAQGRGAITVDTLAFLKQTGGGGPVGAAFSLPAEGISLEDLEMALVRQALDASGDNQSAAAKLLGLTRAKFRVLLKRLSNEE